MDEEAFIVWQDVLDEIAAGRPSNLACPYCGHHPLRVEERGHVAGGPTRITCDGCGQFIEGIFTGH